MPSFILFATAELIGINQIFFLSQDDKARVPIGVTAANLQAPLLMRMEYKVSLPDHDFVVGEGHKLIPSVYAACDISHQHKVTYSGPTYIAVRSGITLSCSLTNSLNVLFEKA